MSDGRRLLATCSAVVVGVLPLFAVAGCSSSGGSKTAIDIGSAPRAKVRDGGTLRWAIDKVPDTLNVFQADSDQGTARVAGAVLPALFTLDERGRPHRNQDYLKAADIVSRKPRQVVVYKINPKAVWSNGEAVTHEDFVAQWKALNGTDSSYWPARNDGYRQIEKVERGADEREVRVTFAQPYADWRSLFTPLYPRGVMGNADAFNDGSRSKLPVSAGPFELAEVQHGGKDPSVTLVRSDTWWGDKAKADRLVLRAVPYDRRAGELDRNALDIAELSARAPAPAGGSAAAHYPSFAEARGIKVRKASDAALTQLTLNGTTGPLADEQVRKAVARAIDRKALAKAVLQPLGLPAKALGNHLITPDQDGYHDNSSVLGGPNRDAASKLLARAGWRPGQPKPVPSPKASAAPSSGGPSHPGDSHPSDRPAPASKSAQPTHPKRDAPSAAEGSAAAGSDQGEARRGQGAKPPADTNPQGNVRVVEPSTLRVKHGKPLSLRLVVPGQAALLGTIGEEIAEMLSKVGARTEIIKVSDDSFFRDHVAAGQFDLAVFSWPATAFPATEARPIYAKPLPAPDGSLIVEQNYARIGTDEIDRLFSRASGELDAGVARSLADDADQRIWASGHSLPLFQRPQLVAVKEGLANVGAFGFLTPRYQDMGFTG